LRKVRNILSFDCSCVFQLSRPWAPRQSAVLGKFGGRDSRWAKMCGWCSRDWLLPLPPAPASAGKGRIALTLASSPGPVTWSLGPLPVVRPPARLTSVLLCAAACCRIWAAGPENTSRCDCSEQSMLHATPYFPRRFLPAKLPCTAPRGMGDDQDNGASCPCR
jgi:hypothetical protein